MTGHHYRISEVFIEPNGKKTVQQRDNYNDQQTLELLETYLGEGLKYVRDAHGYIAFHNGFWLHGESPLGITNVRFEYIGEWEEVPSA